MVWRSLVILTRSSRAASSAGTGARGTATGAGAVRLGLAEDVGRLHRGARSRFLLTGAPVLDGIRHLRQSPTVIFDGTVIDGGDAAATPGM